MRPDLPLPWNVAGVPPEAREAARAAARREGLSVGEWLTRKILRGIADTQGEAANDTPEEQNEGGVEHPSERQDGDGVFARPTHREFEDGASGIIENELRSIARRLETAERTQSENQRALNKTAAEMSVASREHARAVDELRSSLKQLSHRMEIIERQAPGDGLRDAVRGLHQGLARLADQLSDAATHSSDQIAALAEKLHGASEGLQHARLETDSISSRLESRTTQIDERMQAIERRIEANANDTARAAENALAVARLEESLARLEARTRDPGLDRRLSSVERALADVTDRAPIADRRNGAVEEQMRALATRIESSERQQREIANELREAIAGIPRAEARVAPELPELHAVAPHEPQPAFAPPVAAHEPMQVAPEADEHAVDDEVLSALPAPSPLDFPQNAPQPPDLTEALVHSFTPGDEVAPASADEQSPANRAALEHLSPLHDSFLAAARRSAQAAAAQAEVDRATHGFGGFAWSTRASQDEQKPTRFGLLGLAVLAVVLLALAGILFSHRLPSLALSKAVRSNLADNRSLFEPLKTNGSRVTTAPRVRAVSPTPDLGSASQSVKPGQPVGAHPSEIAAKSERMAATDIHAGTGVPGQSDRQPPAGANLQAAHLGPNLAALDRVTALANQGNARAETIVGLRYLDGEGTPPNESEAAKWLARAAEQGEAVAQYRLGTLYEHGRGVPVDSAKAIHWYQAAAQAGNRKAMHNLAVAYAQGAGVSKDFFESARWFSKAAALGLADSQFNLAVLYERGLGVPQSLIDAYKWYAIAAAQGDTESKARIDAIGTQLSADDRAAAQRSADQFKPSKLNAATNVAPQLNDIAG